MIASKTLTFMDTPVPHTTAAIAISLTFLLGTFTDPARARDIKISGLGTRKCVEWHSWKEEKNGELRAMALEWAQGFITGHNLYARGTTTQINSVVADSKILIPLLDSYCQKYPDNRILAGMIEITQSLGGARVNLSPKPIPKTPSPRKDGKTEQES